MDSNAGMPEMLRILRYSYSVVLFKSDRFADAAKEASQLASEYFDVLGLSERLVFGKNPPEIWPHITRGDTVYEDLKRLADCLDIYAMAMSSMQQDSFPARITAVKFYSMCGAVTSAVRVGQDFADEILRITKNPQYAKEFIESALIPTVRDYKLVDHVIPVRAQYAVVLAYCGKTQDALAEIQRRS
jgi:hypothetical protein